MNCIGASDASSAGMRVFAVGLGLLVSGCGLGSTDFTMTRTLPIVATTEDPLCTKQRVKVDLSEDAQFREAQGHIGGLTLKRVTLGVGPVGEGNAAREASGALRVAATESGEAQTLAVFAKLPVETNASQDLALDMFASSALTGLILRAPHVVFVEGEGCSDQAPAFYALDATFVFTVQLKAF